MSGSGASPGNDANEVRIVTSFHLKLSREVLEDNVRIALLNALTPGVSATHILLEGEISELIDRIHPRLAEQLSCAIDRGEICMRTITTRPSYSDILEYSNTLGSGFIAIANSDILFPAETVSRIANCGVDSFRHCFALTRWNVTQNGMYLQGMAPSPPWPEREVGEMRRHEKNYFSYDAYVFRLPVRIPPDTASVFIGSFGCDTTLVSLLKISGYTVANPALTLRIAHFDAKPRSYRSPSAIADLDRNVEAFVSASNRPESGLSRRVCELFNSQARLARGRLWFGHGDVGRFGRALQRALGATAWSVTAEPIPLERRTVRVDRSEIERMEFEIDSLVDACERKSLFIEWETTGFRQDEHVLDLLMNSPYRNRALPLWQYQWQSLRGLDQLTPDDLQLYDAVMETFSATMMRSQGGSGHLAPLSDADAAVMSARMAGLMTNDLEPEPSPGDASGLPPWQILMIDPDGVDAHGHYLPYDLRLQNAALERSVSVSFLMRKEFDSRLFPSGVRAHCLLESHSWDIAIRGVEHPIADAFVAQLSEALAAEKCLDPGHPILIYMYCGSFEHARLVHEVMAGFDDVAAVIHLFSLSMEAYKSEAYLDRWAPFARSIADDPRIRLTVATEHIQEILRQRTGVFFDAVPHPSTTFGDNADPARWAPRRMGSAETPVVLFPGAPREEKGFSSTLEAVRILTTTGAQRHPCVVAGRTRQDTPRHLLDGLASIQNPLVEIEGRQLEAGDFIEFLAKGDIIVLPYKASAFAERPSGLLIDAISLGRPIVVLDGTWLADPVRRYGWGEVVADDGGVAIASAVRRISANYQQYADAIRTSREGYLRQHSWSRLVKSILTGVRPGERRQPVGSRIVGHDRASQTLIDETASAAQVRQATLPAPTETKSEQVLPKRETDVISRPDDLTRFRSAFADRRCFVMGNGPSLNKMDLSKLEGEVVFGCNSVFLLFDRIKWRPSFYTCVDSRVLPDRAAEIATMLRENPGMQAFFPTELLDHISKALTPTRTIMPALPNIAYFQERWNSKDNPPYSMFSVDINDHIIQPYTVAITMLQIAMYMGFSEIYLIGCDTSYTIPADVKKEGLTERGDVGLGLTSTQDNDPNHFDSRYFGKGRKWHDPQVDKMIDHYRYAREVSELGGRTKIFNATVGGNLEVFPRVDFDALFSSQSAEQKPRSDSRMGARDSYIRPGQTITMTKPVTEPATSPASGGSALTLFRIAASVAADGRRVDADSVPPLRPVAPPRHDQRPDERKPSVQSTSDVAPDPRPSQGPTDPVAATPPETAVAPVGALRWIGFQLLRRPALQLAAVLALGLILGAGVLLVLLPAGEFRSLMFAGAGFGLLGAGGLYFAVRVLRLAQRLNAENAAFDKRLREAAENLALVNERTRTEAMRQSSEMLSLKARMEQVLAAGAEEAISRTRDLKQSLEATRHAQEKTSHEVKALMERLVGVERAVAASATEASSSTTSLRGLIEINTKAQEAIGREISTLRGRLAGIEHDQGQFLSLASEVRSVSESVDGLGLRTAGAEATLSALGLREAAQHQEVSRLGESMTHLVDQSGSTRASVNEALRLIGSQAESVQTRIGELVRTIELGDQSVREELGRELASFRQATDTANAAEVGALRLQVATTADRFREELAGLGNQLADVALLSQQLATEVRGRLERVDAIARDARMRAVDSDGTAAAIREALDFATDSTDRTVARIETQIAGLEAALAEQKRLIDRTVRAAGLHALGRE